MLLGAAALLCATVRPAEAHIVPLIDLEHGIVMTPAQCRALPMTVWVGAMGRSVCMRYYLSSAGGEGTRPLVHLSGDKIGSLRADGTWTKLLEHQDTDTDQLLRFTDGLSKQAKVPAIFLARLGLDGSSGDHRDRGTVFELQITNAALDAIKQRYRFDGFHLVGQSGGSTLVGGLLALRTDIGCAVPGSGPLARSRPPSRRAPQKQFVNPIEAVQVIARHSTARILVVTDPKDGRVLEQNQTPFVMALRKAGHPVDQFMVEGTGELHHGVVHYARTIAAACIRGAATPEIAQDVQRLIEKTLAQRNAPKGAAKDTTKNTTKDTTKIATGAAPPAPAVAPRPIAEDRTSYIVSP